MARIDHKSLKTGVILSQCFEYLLKNARLGPVDRQGMFACPKGGAYSGCKASWLGHIHAEHRSNDSNIAGKI